MSLSKTLSTWSLAAVMGVAILAPSAAHAGELRDPHQNPHKSNTKHTKPKKTNPPAQHTPPPPAQHTPPPQARHNPPPPPGNIGQ